MGNRGKTEKSVIFMILSVFLFFLSPLSAFAVSVEKSVICEEIRDREPVKTAIVFRGGIEKIYCYSFLDNISENTAIFHNWYKKDQLSSKIRLAVKQPRWATYSSIQLRGTDRGAWRVEITDSSGNVLKILRFSIVD